MDCVRSTTVLLILSLISQSLSQSLVHQITPHHRKFAISDRISVDRSISRDDSFYCDSWRFSEETNDAGMWAQIPLRCEAYVKDYMIGDRYRSDSEVVADDSLAFAKTVEVVAGGNGKPAWVFDVDETLLSNVPYYAAHGFGSEIFDESSFDDWVDLAEAPALPASLRLHRELQQLGFTIFLLTGRSEPQRNVTEKNLLDAGYTNWERLLLRGHSDIGKPATIYKSEKRTEIEDAGYTILGNSGDQWSDLLGFAVANRSFKLPNPMYYIP